MYIDKIKKAKERRKFRIRKSLFGSQDRPRMSVFRSNKHIYAQIIDDFAGVTLASASTMSSGLKGQIKNCSNRDAAAKVGEMVAKKALEVGIKCVCFDRNRYKYHGRVKALADAARKAGLAF